MTVTAMPKNDPRNDGGTPKRRPVRLIAFVLVLAVAAAAGWFLVLSPRESGAGAAPKPGVVEKLDSMQINLTDGHYLRVGIALQLTDKAGEEVDGSKALDAEIDTFSGLSMAQVMAKGAREQLKERLRVELKSRYEGKVMDIYYTEFVTQ